MIYVLSQVEKECKIFRLKIFMLINKKKMLFMAWMCFIMQNFWHNKDRLVNIPLDAHFGIASDHMNFCMIN